VSKADGFIEVKILGIITNQKLSLKKGKGSL
jgi:hypothetical protein